MKLFIDDERPAPRGWILATDCRDAIEVMQTCAAAGAQLEAVSLDHDLGCSGETILPVLEAMRDCNWWPRELYIHTANEDAEEDMLAFIRANMPNSDDVALRGYGCNFWGTGSDSQVQNWVTVCDMAGSALVHLGDGHE